MSIGYWVGHPQIIAFISAFSPEDVGRSLEAAGDWPAGSYVIRMHEHGVWPAGGEDPRWGHAVKDGNGNVRVEPDASQSAGSSSSRSW